MQSLKQTDPITYAYSYINAENTRFQYTQHLKMLLQYLELPCPTLEAKAQAFLDKARADQNWAQEVIMQFLNFHKENRVVNKKEITAGTLKSYSQPIKLFCDMNDLNSINWKRIAKALPKARMAANDRAPTVDELKKLVEYADRRIKAIVFVMASSGIRLGAWDYLKWKHVIPIEREGKLVAAKLIVYADDAEEYYSFITPQGFRAVKEWMDYRKAHDEKITGESWLMRNLWRTADVKISKTAKAETGLVGGKYGLATCPKKISANAIKKILCRALYEQGIRYTLPDGARRHEWKEAHGLRKFFKTRAQQVMSPMNVELLMGHSLGLSDSYYKPQEADVLTDYLRAVPLLSLIINDESGLQAQAAESAQENERLQKRVVELEMQNEKQLEGLGAELNAYIAKSDRSYSELIARLEARSKEREEREQQQQIV